MLRGDLSQTFYHCHHQTQMNSYEPESRLRNGARGEVQCDSGKTQAFSPFHLTTLQLKAFLTTEISHSYAFLGSTKCPNHCPLFQVMSCFKVLSDESGRGWAAGGQQTLGPDR